MNKTLLSITCFIFLCLSLPLSLEAETKNKSLSIEIDLWKKELFVLEDGKILEQFPVSIGTELSPTPIGNYMVIEKAKSWGGGFGSRWLGLDVPWGIYGIHGTNKPYLIGEDVSSGCIRMLNRDVEKLYEMIPVDTSVNIVGPIMGVGKGEHKSLSVGSKGNLVQLVQGRLKAMGLYKGDVNGIYGPRTEKAVKEFQKLNQISINGVITYREYVLLGLIE